ncbi:LysR substrate-binding domain-containing protein [Dokdonella sp.]|uniref:LysR substrate-binding domain-containing protein n=1 Tax=Dokdonella sp. TaxID=2291710 RepID=UPI0031BF5B7C|nr:LysR substrate-binding domain-containing protein [Dokdonella sp.]
MNLRDLAYLVALAEHRHFGRAAAASFVSQPTLSTQIRKLEEELDISLVERMPRKIRLTDAGEEIVRHAREALNEVAQIRAVARRTIDPQSGTVRLGLFPTLGPYLLPHVVPKLRERFPRLELLLREEKTEVVLEQLREGRLDAGILALPIHDAQLHQEFLFEEPFLLAVPEGHPLANRECVRLDDLADQKLLLLEDGHCLRDQALEVCQRAGTSERSGFRATSLETLRQMVAAGVGATLLPVLAIKPPVAPSADIRLVRFHAKAPSRRIAMVWRKTSAMAPFFLELARVFADLPAGLLDPAEPVQHLAPRHAAATPPGTGRTPASATATGHRQRG